MTGAGPSGWSAPRGGYLCQPLYSAYERQECDGEIRGVISAVGIGSVPEVERSEEPAAGQAATRPKPPSKAALRRLREAEAQARALRIQLAQLAELAGTHGPDEPLGS